MTPFFKLISLFTPAERRRLIPIMFGILCTSVLEIAGIGSLGPFMAVVTDPSIVQSQPMLAFLYQTFGFQSDRGFLIFLGIAVFFIVLITTISRMAVSYVMYRYTGNRRYSLGLRLFRQYLYQPYYFFLNHNSGELSKKLLSEVDSVINSVLLPGIDICIRGVMILAILIFIVVINPIIAAIAFGMFGLLSVVFYRLVRSRLSYYGKGLSESNQLRYKAAAEAFGGIKDIKILGKESFFIHSYSIGAKRFVAMGTKNQILQMIPGQSIQFFAVGFTIAIVIILLGIGNGALTEILPMLVMYAFAILRLMPNVQMFFQDAAGLRGSGYIVDSLYMDMTALSPLQNISDARTMYTAPEVLPFSHQIELKRIEFSYPASREPVLKGIDLSIAKNMTIGFVGATGCGKTTLVDVIMGLLEPEAGSIIVDDIQVIPALDIAPWQRNFGYVPQRIYLSDDTVAANIAFGVPEDVRDMAAVERAARIANLHQFITAELPEGYSAIVGEQGIRLSGGQHVGLKIQSIWIVMDI